MTRHHQLGRAVTGHPVLWLVVLAGCAVGAFLQAGAWLDELARDGELRQHEPITVIVYAAVWAAFGMFCVVRSVRVAWLCWKMYRPRPVYPEGACKRCGYDLRTHPERCPECGARNRR